LIIEDINWRTPVATGRGIIVAQFLTTQKSKQNTTMKSISSRSRFIVENFPAVN